MEISNLGSPSPNEPRFLGDDHRLSMICPNRDERRAFAEGNSTGGSTGIARRGSMRFASVKDGHRLFDIPADDGRQILDQMVDGFVDHPAFARRRSIEDVANHRLSGIRRAADTDPDAHEIAAAQAGDDIAQAVMATMAAASFEADGACGDIEIVMSDAYPFDRDPVEGRHRRHRPPAFVHESVRAKKTQPLSVDIDCGFHPEASRQPLEATFAASFGHPIEQPSPRIMTGGFVASPGIAEPDQQLAWSGQCGKGRCGADVARKPRAGTRVEARRSAHREIDSSRTEASISPRISTIRSFLALDDKPLPIRIRRYPSSLSSVSAALRSSSTFCGCCTLTTG